MGNSLLFDDASTEYAHITTAVVANVPCTLDCWFYTDQATLGQLMMTIGDEAAGNHSARFFISTTVNAQSRSTSTATATTSTNVSANTWHHAAAVFAGVADRRAFLDGGGKGTNSTSITINNANAAHIGIRDDHTFPFSGKLARCTWRDVALTDDEIAALAAGVNPLHIRPASIKAYIPLGLASPEPDWSPNDKKFTLVNAPTADAIGPPVTLYTPKWAAGLPLIEVAAGGGFAHTQAVIIA